MHRTDAPGEKAMGQLTIYIDDETRERVERAAREADVSVSNWVRDRIEHALEDRWSEDYFELFGSLAEEDIERPEQPPSDRDRKREQL